jgi:hypothetical protein
MSDLTSPAYTADEIALQMQQHARALPYLMTAFALECGRTPDDAAAFVGRMFATGWEEARGQGALTVVRSMALNLVAAGGELRSLVGDEGHAKARVAGLSGEEELAFMGLSREQADRFNGSFTPIAEHLGLRAAWRREGEEIVLTVDQPG